MNLIWLIYWIVLLISVIFGIYIFIKKDKILGVIQCVFTLAFSIYTFIYVMHRDFVNGESEIEFIYQNLLNHEIGTIFVVLLLISLIGVFIYNLFCLKEKNRRGGHL